MSYKINPHTKKLDYYEPVSDPLTATQISATTFSGTNVYATTVTATNISATNTSGGIILLSDGVAYSQPSLSWISDSDTGFCKVVGSQFEACINGTRYFSFHQAGLSLTQTTGTLTFSETYFGRLADGALYLSGSTAATESKFKAATLSSTNVKATTVTATNVSAAALCVGDGTAAAPALLLKQSGNDVGLYKYGNALGLSVAGSLYSIWDTYSLTLHQLGALDFGSNGALSVDTSLKRGGPGVLCATSLCATNLYATTVTATTICGTNVHTANLCAHGNPAKIDFGVTGYEANINFIGVNAGAEGDSDFVCRGDLNFRLNGSGADIFRMTYSSPDELFQGMRDSKNLKIGKVALASDLAASNFYLYSQDAYSSASTNLNGGHTYIRGGNKAGSGTAGNVYLASDGTNAVGSIIASGNLSAGNVYATTVTATNLSCTNLCGSAWEDIRVAGLSMRTNASAPGLVTLSGGLLTYGFDGDSTSEQVYFAIQIPHNYKLSSTIYPHVHWFRTVEATGNVVWFLEYSMAAINNKFPSTSTISAVGSAASGPAASAQNIHLMTSFPTVAGTTLSGVSSMIVGRLYRDPADAVDTYEEDAGLLEFDIHYQVDSLGSDSESSKSF